MASKPANYFVINRKLLNSERWLSEPFTKGQAWVDLIGLAQHSPGAFTVRGITVSLERGQLGWSEVRLAERWKWSRMKVRRYIKRLESDMDVIQQKNKVTTIITIVKYDIWQGEEKQNDTTKKTTNDTTNDTHTIINKKEIKNDYIARNAKELLDFYNQVFKAKLKSTAEFEGNLKYWLQTYSLEEIKQAVVAGKRDKWWSDKLTPLKLLRRKNTAGENVNYIGDLLSRGASAKKEVVY